MLIFQTEFEAMNIEKSIYFQIFSLEKIITKNKQKTITVNTYSKS